jgi:hypothetical protein
LVVEECRLPASAITSIANSRHLTNLVSLSLRDIGFGDAGLKELLKWPGLAKVCILGLGQNEFTNTGAKALAECAGAANLRWLWLRANRIGVAGAEALAESPHLARLKDIALYDNPAAGSPAAMTLLRRRFGKGLLI